MIFSIFRSLIRFIVRKIIFTAALIGILILFIYNSFYGKDIAANFGLADSYQKTGVTENKHGSIYGIVTKTVDGDTFKCRLQDDDRVVTIRLIGVDCPESVNPDVSKNTPEGKTASNYTKKILTKKKIRLEYDVDKTDKYGRQLCYAFLLDGSMYNETLLKKGMAKVLTVPPNVKYVKKFTKDQKEASDNNNGFWDTVW